MTFKHITDWRIDNINFIDTYETNWSVSNYWTNKISNESDLQTTANALVEQLQSVMTSLNALFKSTNGSVDFSALSSELQKSKYYSELLKEYVFEEIRQAEFPNKPSRKKCIYLAPFEVDIFEYASKLNYDLSAKTLMEIEVTQKENLHFADLALLNCNVLPHNEKVNAARQYWQGTTNRDNNTEVLYTGQFKIKALIQK